MFFNSFDFKNFIFLNYLMEFDYITNYFPDLVFLYFKKYFTIFFFIFSLVQIPSFKNKPKISIYMPIYNKSKYLKRSIKSIQNQTLTNIEIIAVNDCSTDDSLNILKTMNKKDSRIKIINNNRNYGLLYTRAMGILKTTGEYILNVDPDDLLYENNVLEYLYKIANQFKVDVISFGILENQKYSLKCKNIKQILKQPKILEQAFSHKHYLKDYLLWNKLIKRNLMIKSYEIFKSNIFSERWNYGEDTIWSVLINKYAKSMICIDKIIYKYNIHKDSLMHDQFNIIRIKNIFKFEEMYRQILNKKKEKKYIISNIIAIIDYFNNHKNKLSLMTPQIDIKDKLINLLKIYIQNYKIPNNIIYNFNKVILKY
jgi:glycosyltransferase involved in cell wall biosynthesis